MKRLPGIVLIVLGAAQLFLLVAVVQPIDWGWQIVGILGTTYWIGLFVAVGVVVATIAIKHEALLGIATLIAALAALAGAASWASLGGGPLLLGPSEALRIWTILVADGCLAAWAILVALDGGARSASGIALIAGLLAVRTVLEWLYFVPILVPANPPVEQLTGDTSGAGVLLFGAVFLGGYILVAVWELVLGRSVLRAASTPHRRVDGHHGGRFRDGLGRSSEPPFCRPRGPLHRPRAPAAQQARHGKAEGPR